MLNDKIVDLSTKLKLMNVNMINNLPNNQGGGNISDVTPTLTNKSNNAGGSNTLTLNLKTISMNV